MKTIFKKLRNLCVLPAVLFTGAALVTPSAKAQITGFDVNFNGGASTYTGNFNRENDSPETGFTWGASLGTGGSGGLAVDNTGPNNIFYRPDPPSDSTSTFDFLNAAAGTTFTSNTDFVWSNTTTTTSPLTVLTAGFVGDNTSAGALTSTSSLAGSIIRAANSSTVTLRMRNANSNAQTLDFDQSSLTAGNWYRLTYDLTKTATTNAFDYRVSLFSIGADGTGTPVLFNDGTKNITISGTASNSGIYTDANAYFAYDIRDTSTNTGITHVDNFSVVPEPITGSLLAIGFGMLVLTRGQRRR